MKRPYRVAIFLLLSINSILFGVLAWVFGSIGRYLNPFVPYYDINIQDSYTILLSSVVVCVIMSALVLSLFTIIGRYSIHLYRTIALVTFVFLIFFVLSIPYRGLHLGGFGVDFDRNLARKLFRLSVIADVLFLISALLLGLSVIPAWNLRCPLRLDLTDRDS